MVYSGWKGTSCEEEYDGYLQLENGVGMLRLLETEVKETLKELTGDDRKVTGRIATGSWQRRLLPTI